MRRRRGEMVVLVFSQQGWGEAGLGRGGRCAWRALPSRHCHALGGVDAWLAGQRCDLISTRTGVFEHWHSSRRLCRPCRLPIMSAGNFANTLTILLLLAVQGATGAVVTSSQAEVAWRVQVRRLHLQPGACALRNWKDPPRACRASMCLFGRCLKLGATSALTCPGTLSGLQFGIGTLICAALAAYRWTYLQARPHSGTPALTCSLALLRSVCSTRPAGRSRRVGRVRHSGVAQHAMRCEESVGRFQVTLVRGASPLPDPRRSPRFGRRSGTTSRSSSPRRG